MRVFSLADAASSGQNVALNTMKLQTLKKEQEKTNVLETLYKQRIQPDGTVDTKGLATDLTAAGFPKEGLELQMQNQEQDRLQKEQEYQHAKDAGAAFTTMWDHIKTPASKFLETGSEKDLNTLQSMIDVVAPQLDYKLPDDPEEAKVVVKSMLPVMEAQGELHKYTEAAANARLKYGENSDEFKAASSDLIRAQNEMSVKQAKAKQELDNSRLEYEKKQLEMKKIEKDINKEDKWTIKNVSLKGKTVQGRVNDKGQIQVRDDAGNWTDNSEATLAGVKSSDTGKEKWDKTVQAARDYVKSQGYTVGQQLEYSDRIKDPNIAKQMETAMRQKFSEGGGIPQEAIDELNKDPSDEAKQEFEDAFGVSADDYIE